MPVGMSVPDHMAKGEPTGSRGGGICAARLLFRKRRERGWVESRPVMHEKGGLKTFLYREFRHEKFASSHCGNA